MPVKEKDDRSRPFAGMTRIRFEGSPPGLHNGAVDSQPPAWGSPRNNFNLDLGALYSKGSAINSWRQARFRCGRLALREPDEARAVRCRRGCLTHRSS